jgi:hypothetical protein
LTRGSERGSQVVVQSDHCRFGARARQHLEIGRNDNAERTEGSEIETGHVVSRDILHDHASGFGDRAARVRHGDSDQEIPERTSAVAQRPPATSGDESADGGIAGSWRIERQTLSMLREHCLNISESRARADR